MSYAADHYVKHPRLHRVLAKVQTPTQLFTPTPADLAVVTLQEFFHELNTELDIPHTTHVANAEVAWATAEGGRAWWNPLNTTRVMNDGEWDYNWVHVKSYPTKSVGIAALKATLLQHSGIGDFSSILDHLRRSAPAAHTLKAVERTAWGTGGLALAVLPQVQRDYKRWASRPVAPT